MMNGVLVVEDEPEIREIFSKMLGRAGYAVFEAADGAEALEKLRHCDVDVVLLDLMIPKIGGLDVLNVIRDEHPTVEVVVATADNSAETITRCFRQGATDVLAKPASSGQLLASVALALERQRERVTRGMYQVCEAVLSTAEAGRLPQVIVQAAITAMQADDVSLLLPGENGNLFVAHASGMSPEMQATIQVQLGERIAGRVAVDREPALIRRSLSEDQRFEDLADSDRIRSSIVYPMVAGDRLAAVLNISRTRPEAPPFCRADLSRASVVASLSLLALENARLVRRAVVADRLATLGTLAASITHEINNPLMYARVNLSTISGHLAWVEGLASRLEEPGTPERLRAWFESTRGHERIAELREAARDASHGVERICDIASDMRTVSRSDEGSKARVDLNDAVRSAIRLASVGLRHRTRVNASFARGVMVQGSASALAQVYLNLILNAGQAIEASGKAGGVVTVATRRVGDRVVSEVSDNGPGIAPQHLKRLFEPFFTTKSASTGTGLGLWISQEVVRRHGGELSVESTLGEGATFRVVLPLAEAEGERPSVPLPRAGEMPPPGARSRVLFVDDEPATLRAYERHFVSRFDVTMADDGVRALQLLRSGLRFDVVVCDMLMKEMNGMELYEALQQSDPELARRFVFVTGSALHADVQDFLRANAVRLLEKPLTLAALEAALDAQLGALGPVGLKVP